MSTTVDITIEPNDKYRRVIGIYASPTTDSTDAGTGTDDYEEWPDEHQEAADDFIKLVDSAPVPEDHGVDEDELDTLSWSDISPASDPDLLAKVATYFDGMTSDEPTDLLRAKCRLLEVEIYVDAQIAAEEELRGDE